MKGHGQLSTTRQTHQRMTEVFEANEPLESAVLLRMSAARQRLGRAREERKRRGVFAWGSALASLCLCGTAFAVAVQTGHVKLIPSPQADAAETQPKETTSIKPAPSHSTEDADSTGDGSIEKQQDQDVPEPAAPTLPLRHKPLVAQPPRQLPQERTKEREETPNWQQVAGAMREGKDEKAKKAVSSLAASGDPETRDSAELIRLRIELGSERAGTLRATNTQRRDLERLSKKGASPSIRSSAKRLLRRLAPVGVRDFGEVAK